MGKGKLNRFETSLIHASLIGILFFGLTVGVSIKAEVQENNSAAMVGNPCLEKGRGLFYQGRRMFYSGETDISEAVNTLVSARETLDQMTDDDFDKYYCQAQVEFVLGRIAEESGKKSEAVEQYTKSSQLAKKAFDYNKKSSEAHRLLADTYLRLINLKGAVYAMSYGPQALKLLNVAVSLDKCNYPAYNSLGIYYYHLPIIWGGSSTKALKYLRKALESKDEFDNFLSYTYLGIVYNNQNKIREATDNLDKALAIYPGNLWAKGVLEEVKGKANGNR
jgi:tetratricopeptide (TPR) repeat protein